MILLANQLLGMSHNDNEMKNNLILETDKTKAKEGEFIEIRWECTSCPDSLLLILDSGYKSDKLMVSDKGATKIAIPRCKRKFHISLAASVNGKKDVMKKRFTCLMSEVVKKKRSPRSENGNYQEKRRMQTGAFSGPGPSIGGFLRRNGRKCYGSLY